MTMNKIAFSRILTVVFLGLFIVGCGTNPVTGKRELSFYSTASQIQMGQENYAPSTQSQGGEYYLDPELNKYISTITQELVAATRVEFPESPDLPYEIVVLNNGVPNAWALPGGKMAINRGLLTELNDESELAAVIGHEIIHAAAGHSAAQMSRNTIFGVGLAAVGIASSGSEYGDLINYGSQIGSAAWMSKYGRDDELESDYYGMRVMARAGYDPVGAVRLQETFVRMSGGQQQDFLSGLFASHPPSQNRVDANRQHLNELPVGGKVNEVRYQNAIAQLRKDQEAYEAQDEAVKALNDNKPDAALKLLDRAVEIQPGEGQFWELRGHAWQMQNNNSNAEKAFTTAIDKNPGYYQHWLARGLLRREMGKNTAAESDIERGQQLLPTATGSYLLGEFAEKRGDRNTAISYYQQAASAGGDVGGAATSKLIRYDLPANPGKYIASGLRLNDRGEIVAVVRNDAGFDVNAVQVRLVDRRNGASKAYNIRGTVAATKQASVNTGVMGDPANYQLQVIAAKAK